jgi:hypothetical protein
MIASASVGELVEREVTAVKIAQLGRRHNLLDDFRIRHRDKKVIAFLHERLRLPVFQIVDPLGVERSAGACPAIFYLASNLAKADFVRSRFCRVGIDQMTHHRFSGKTAGYSPFQLTVGLGLPLMLTQVLCPRVHQKYLQVTIRDFSVAEDCPPIRAIATPHPTIFLHCIHKFCCPFWNDGVFDGN